MKYAAWMVATWAACGAAGTVLGAGYELKPDGYHVFPGQRIQDALQAASVNPTQKVVRVHAGEYKPASKGQALIWFNRAHDGIRLEAVGDVTLTAAAPELTSPRATGFPAVVNHVVYFGHGVSSNTVLEGFRLTGANGFVTDKLTRTIEPDGVVSKNLFFYTDGGAIKVFGRSSPVIRKVRVVSNFATPCGGGVSVQQMGFRDVPVRIQDCVFEWNRAQVTGAAIDLLEGSSAVIENCLFVGNVANTGIDVVARRSGEKPFTNNGALTVFQNSSAIVRRCTFTGNRNGVDDLGGLSRYENCIFWDNRLQTAAGSTDRYDLDLRQGGEVSGCFLSGRVLGRSGTVTGQTNRLDPPPPKFQADYRPAEPAYSDVGFRPPAP